MKNNPRMVIKFTENEVEELMNGAEFRWTFPTDEGVDIDVLITRDENDDY